MKVPTLVLDFHLKCWNSGCNTYSDASRMWLEGARGRSRCGDKFACGADGAPHKLTPAIRASSRKAIFCTICTECAFKRADHRLPGMGREIPVTAFTIGP